MAFKKYCKIPVPFKRSEEGYKEIIHGVWNSEAIELCKDLKWIFTEKVDGTNTRIHWNGHRFEVGARDDDSAIPSTFYRWFNEYFNTDSMEEMFEQLFGEKTVTLFGEWYGKGIQKVGSAYVSDGNKFILFDAAVQGAYINRDSLERLAKTLSLDIVPIIMQGTLEDAISFIKTGPKSTLGDCRMEGVVGILPENLYDHQGNRLIVKIKCKDFA